MLVSVFDVSVCGRVLQEVVRRDGVACFVAVEAKSWCVFQCRSAVYFAVLRSRCPLNRRVQLHFFVFVFRFVLCTSTITITSTGLVALQRETTY